LNQSTIDLGSLLLQGINSSNKQNTYLKHHKNLDKKGKSIFTNEQIEN